jgi:hypothetical protein
MKTIKVNDIELQYKVFEDITEYGSSIWTEFYLGTETVTERKYWLFGSLITKEVPKLVFKIYEDAYNISLSKEFWRTAIQKKLDLLYRREELERGELC